MKSEFMRGLVIICILIIIVISCVLTNSHVQYPDLTDDAIAFKVLEYIDENDKDTRLYTLTEDTENSFLMSYCIGATLMNQPSFYRAIDTKGQNIHIPDYIDSLNDNFWR